MSPLIPLVWPAAWRPQLAGRPFFGLGHCQSFCLGRGWVTRTLPTIQTLCHFPWGKRKAIYWDDSYQSSLASKTPWPSEKGSSLIKEQGRGEMLEVVLHSAGSGEEPGLSSGLISFPRRAASSRVGGVLCSSPIGFKERFPQCHHCWESSGGIHFCNSLAELHRMPVGNPTILHRPTAPRLRPMFSPPHSVEILYWKHQWGIRSISIAEALPYQVGTHCQLSTGFQLHPPVAVAIFSSLHGSTYGTGWWDHGSSGLDWGWNWDQVTDRWARVLDLASPVWAGQCWGLLRRGSRRDSSCMGVTVPGTLSHYLAEPSAMKRVRSGGNVGSSPRSPSLLNLTCFFGTHLVLGHHFARPCFWICGVLCKSAGFS